jgi:anti-anti-sigma regulatory factor
MTSFSIESSPDTVLLRLDSEVTIEQARALHTALAAALTPARPLIVDPAALVRLDAAALQVLLAAARTATRAALATPSTVWTDTLRRHGIADPFVQL